MKKLVCLIAMFSVLSNVALADRVVVIDNNNVVKQELYTQPMASQPQVVYTQPQQVVYTQPQQVVYTQPAPQPVVVVRQTPRVRTYYYDAAATSLVAGFTGALIGHAIWGGHHHHHHHGGHHHRR